MKYYRFMSFEEFHKMGLGLPIVGHEFPDNRTMSSGVCFLGEWTLIESAIDERGNPVQYSALDCYDAFLGGIVSSDVLVEFEVEDGIMSESWGIYADPINYWDWYARISIVEYCTPYYDRELITPVRYCVDVDTYRRGTAPVWYDYH